MDFKKMGNLIQTIAPTIATALGGPLAGLATKTLSEAVFGHADAGEGEISLALASASPDVIMKVKESDQNFKVKMHELDIDLERIKGEDRKSARDMLIGTGSMTPAVLSYSIVIAWGIIQYFLFTTVIEQSMRELVARMFGTLDSALMLVLGFWFGSSSGSHAKDQIINDKGSQK